MQSKVSLPLLIYLCHEFTCTEYVSSRYLYIPWSDSKNISHICPLQQDDVQSTVKISVTLLVDQGHRFLLNISSTSIMRVITRHNLLLVFTGSISRVPTGLNILEFGGLA